MSLNILFPEVGTGGRSESLYSWSRRARVWVMKVVFGFRTLLPVIWVIVSCTSQWPSTRQLELSLLFPGSAGSRNFRKEADPPPQNSSDLALSGLFPALARVLDRSSPGVFPAPARVLDRSSPGMTTDSLLACRSTLEIFGSSSP